jgi:SAM-dependent methyltransferase
VTLTLRQFGLARVCGFLAPGFAATSRRGIAKRAPRPTQSRAATAKTHDVSVTMTLYELAYRTLRLGLEPIYSHVYQVLRGAVATMTTTRKLLDIGGRNSPYTVGLHADTIVTDLPRKTAIQLAKNLGIDSALVKRLRRRRSNIRGVIVDDMTATAIRPSSFGLAVAVEVLEHVTNPERFVSNVATVLSVSGAFVLTTPNGARFDLATVGNPDNRQFFTRATLRELLERHFTDVDVEPAVFDCSFRTEARQLSKRYGGISSSHPLSTIRLLVANYRWYKHGLRSAHLQPESAAIHLIAIARNPIAQSQRPRVA